MSEHLVRSRAVVTRCPNSWSVQQRCPCQLVKFWQYNLVTKILQYTCKCLAKIFIYLLCIHGYLSPNGSAIMTVLCLWAAKLFYKWIMAPQSGHPITVDNHTYWPWSLTIIQLGLYITSLQTNDCIKFDDDHTKRAQKHTCTPYVWSAQKICPLNLTM